MRRIRKIPFSSWQVFFQIREMTYFTRISSHMRKSVSFRITFNAKGSGLTNMNHYNLLKRKIMVCVWWDHHGIIYFEFLNCNQILNGYLYTQQLQYVHGNQREHPAFINRRKIVFFHNIRPNSARITQKKILALHCSVLLHPLY